MPTALTVTATQGGSTNNGMLLTVRVLTGTAVTQNGAIGTQSGSAAHQASVTTTVTGSIVYGTGHNFANTALTINAQSTQIADVADGTHTEHYGTCRATAATGTPGAITIGWSAPAQGGGAAFAEILPNGTIVEDGSAPPDVSTTTAITVTSNSFTPPDGALLVALVSTNGGASVTTMTVSGGGLVWTELAKSNVANLDYAGVWAAQVPPGAAAGNEYPVQALAPGWHPGAGLPGVPGGTPFYAPPGAWVAPAAAVAASPAGTVVFAAPPPRPGPHRAMLGARGALAAGILAVGIGPPAVAAPHQPPAISHPAPHRAAWRTRQGVPPNAAQQVKSPVPVTVYSRRPHAAIWRGGRGASPAALPQPFRPVTVYPRPAHRALWRGGSGPVPAAVQGGGVPQPFRPVTVYSRRPHAAAWRAVQGTPPAARPQPFRPVTVYARAAHRVLWRVITGPPPAAAQNLGAAQPFRPVTVYARKLHGALWRSARGTVPAPVAQPFKPATVYRRAPHAAAWRAITGRAPAGVRQPRTPATVFARVFHRALWRSGAGSPAAPPPAFTIGALTAATAPGATLTASGAPAGVVATAEATAALTAFTAAGGSVTAATYPATYTATYTGKPGGALTAADTRTGGPT